ncbi:hypothetical protein GCM10007304_35680 [Rhodococcoides trifolii]|uniref:Uncharacterized protein n=1 Tax=Rhodococcoides trifolii TaxID=908250 RepID=A0A917LFS0_9NOCA|nr:hypothetical protein GCM10007304_35680 [Rhodococcus trifolii]
MLFRRSRPSKVEEVTSDYSKGHNMSGPMQGLILSIVIVSLFVTSQLVQRYNRSK